MPEEHGFVWMLWDKNIIYNSQQITQVTHFTGKQRDDELSQNRSPLKTPQIKFTWDFQAQNSNRYVRYSLRYSSKVFISKDKIRQILYKGSPHENCFGNLKKKNAIIITKKYLNSICKKLSALAFFTSKSLIKSNNYLFITYLTEVLAMNNLKLILFILKTFITEIPQNTNYHSLQTYCRKSTNTSVRVTLSRYLQMITLRGCIEVSISNLDFASLNMPV